MRILAQSEAEFPIPDLALLLELDVETALARVRARGARVEGAFEARDRLERVARIFASIERPYLIRIDASGSPEAVEPRDRRAGARAPEPPVTPQRPGAPMPQPPAPLDPEKLKDYAKLVFGALGGAMTSAMIYLGDRLGLYRALAGGAPVTSAELAAKTGLSRALAARVAARAGRRGRARAPRRRPLRALARRRGRARERGASGLRRRLLLAAAAAGRRGGAAPRGLPDRYRAALRRVRARGRARRRARARALVPRAAGALRAAAGRRRGASACAPARAAADVGCGAAWRCSRWRRPSRAPSSTATTSRSTRSRAPRRTARAAGVSNASFHDAARDPLPDGRALRLRHDLRLPARHDGPGLRDARGSAARSRRTAPG